MVPFEACPEYDESSSSDESVDEVETEPIVATEPTFDNEATDFSLDGSRSDRVTTRQGLCNSRHPSNSASNVGFIFQNQWSKRAQRANNTDDSVGLPICYDSSHSITQQFKISFFFIDIETEL